MSARESFNPESYELDKSFRLTRFTELKGTGCKVPQDVLQKLLESLQENHFQEDEQFLGAVMPRLGMWTTVFFHISRVEDLGCIVVSESKTGVLFSHIAFKKTKKNFSKKDSEQSNGEWSRSVVSDSLRPQGL